MKVIERSNLSLFSKDVLSSQQMSTMVGGLAGKSIVHSEGDCSIDSGDACDWTTIDPDCPPTVAAPEPGDDYNDAVSADSDYAHG